MTPITLTDMEKTLGKFSDGGRIAQIAGYVKHSATFAWPGEGNVTSLAQPMNIIFGRTGQDEGLVTTHAKKHGIVKPDPDPKPVSFHFNEGAFLVLSQH
jgi:hypothetical protein